MALTVLQEALKYSFYFAPRGKKRLLLLGHQIAQRYLSPMDRLFGIVGDAGAGKSLLIKGMFPGLELTNDDNGVNVRPLPLLEGTEDTFFNSHTYHIDVRFESAFTQMHVLADAVNEALKNDKRVIVEHFDLLYPFLKVNAEILIGIGDEVIVTRPNVYGPQPKEISNIVFESLKYRKMAHTAEDITSRILEDEYGIPNCEEHSDVKHGFVLEFHQKPDFDIGELENRILEVINMDIDIVYYNDKNILINDKKHPCTGPRIHVKSSGEIENFRLVKEYIYNPISKVYSLVGTVGKELKGSYNINRFF